VSAVNDAPANIATAASAVSASVSVTAFLAQANQVVSLIAGLVAIIAGLYAIAHYRRHRK
jgi:hypothetical protein